MNAILPRTTDCGAAEQIAWVPDDFEKALHYWTETMGVGPFFMIRDIPTLNARYRGQPITLSLSVALAYWGNLQVELIQQHSDASSGYTIIPAGERDGRIHHIAVDTDDPEALRQYYLARGGETMMEFDVPGMGTAIYMSIGENMPLYEIRKLTPQSLTAFDYMKAATRAWDGTDPVRDLPADLSD